MTKIRESYHLSERHACRLLNHRRGTQRYTALAQDDEDELTPAVIALAGSFWPLWLSADQSAAADGWVGGWC